MTVPEAAVDEDAGPELGQHNVRRAGETADILAETEASPEQFPAQHDLGHRILRPDMGHAVMPL